jgi:proliferating cell nuclear antigen
MQPEENTIFRCKTNDAYTIKMLFELLHNNIKTGCFELHKEGIRLCMTDSNRRTLIDVKINAREFNFYMLTPETLRMGINVHHVYKMLRSVKKKDSMIMFINESNPSDLGIQIIPKDQTRLTTSFVRIQNIQNLEIMVPEGYTNNLLVPSSEFCKVCKNMLTMSNTITISAIRDAVRFVCNLGSVYSREEILGENVDEEAFENPFFQDDFDTEQLQRIIEVTGLSNNLNIHCNKGLPLYVETRIGNLGALSLYVKSRRQLEEEQLHAEI